MTRGLIAVVAMACASCGPMPRVDVCKHAAVRRSVYVTAIRAAEVTAASGRPVPMAVGLGREAAATALAVLNANCPLEPGSPNVSLPAKVLR